MKKLSIITVCLNEKKDISKTLKSVVNQSFQDFEFIVIDGLSIDGTVDIIKNYLGKITYFISEKDNGVYAAMNKGISYSTGEYLLFLNGGDYLADNYVLENIFKQSPTADILYGDLRIDNQILSKIISYQNIKIDAKYLFNNYLPHPATFIKRELFTKFGLYNENYDIVGDYDFFLRVLVKNKVIIKYIPIVVSVFKAGGVSNDFKTSRKHLLERRSVRQKNYGLMNYYKLGFISKLKNIFCKHHNFQSNNKILLFAEFNDFGGTRTYFKELLRFYYDLKIDVLVILDRHKKRDQKIIALIKFYGFSIKFAILSPLKTKNIIGKIINFSCNLYNFSKLVLKFSNYIVVISGWSPYKFLSSFFLPIRSINIVHSYPVSKLSIIFRFFIKHGINRKHLFVTVSNFSKKNIKHYWLDDLYDDYVKVVYNFSELEDLPIRTMTHKTPVVLTMGHVIWYKNPDTWLSVAKKVNEIKKVNFIWAGDGDQLIELKKKNKQEGNKFINFLGFQSDVDSLYQKCDIYFQPSLLESFGLSIVEAMRRGIPVVASNIGGIPELIHNNKNGILVDPMDIEQIVSKIIWLLDNDLARQDISKNSHDMYKINFSREKWTDEFLKINKSIYF